MCFMSLMLEDVLEDNPNVFTHTPLVDVGDLHHSLKCYWGFDSFRPLQLESIRSILTRQDSITLFPTGGGKSLCYQLPILYFPQQTALVISPLISLMEDQVQQAQAKGFSVSCLNSSQSPEERRDIFNRFRAGTLQLLYVSPEKLANPSFIEALQTQGQIAYIAVDEAHCISQWGHQFRPDYQRLGELRTAFPALGIHAFTATAPKRVVEDIEQSLQLREADRFQASMLRANLEYRVEERSQKLEVFLQSQLLPILKSRQGQAGIIYCLSRKDVEDLSLSLQVNGINAKAYHAGLPDALRTRNQEAFMRGDIHIMVATTAFGMGIDRADIRFVIHASMPQSLEGYVQEAGRAGRDGLPSTCYLFKRPNDERSWTSMLQKNGESTHKLWGMLMYSDSQVCRHRLILDYFGQVLQAKRCTGCDVCQTRPRFYPQSTLLMQHVFSVIHRLKQHASTDCILGVLRGDLALIPLGLRETVQDFKSYGAFASEQAFKLSLFLEQLERLHYISHASSTGENAIFHLEAKAMKWIKEAEENREDVRLMIAEAYCPPLKSPSPAVILPNAMPKPTKAPRRKGIRNGRL